MTFAGRGQAVGCEAAMRALAGRAAAVDARREAVEQGCTPHVLAELADAGLLDALASDDANALPDPLRARARRWLDRLGAALLGCFPRAGVGVRVADLPEFEQVLERTALRELREPIVARMPLDVADFVSHMLDGLQHNPVLVTLAAELAQLPDEWLWPPALATADAVARATEVRSFVSYAQMLDAIATECLLEPPGDGRHPEALFIHRMYTAVAARLDRLDWQPHANAFERMKIPSMLWPFRVKYMDLKTGVRPFDLDASGGHALQANILEAMFQDTLLGWDDNAAAGFELFAQSVDKAPQPVLGEDIVREWVPDGHPTGVALSMPAFARAWANLYTSWNASFCGNYEELPYFLAKLFTPAVATIHHTRHPGLYIYTRVMALLVHLAFLMSSRERAGWAPRCSALNWRSEGLQLVWGRINRAAADAYQRRVEGALEREEGWLENLDYDGWRAAKLATWASVRTLARGIELTHDVGDRIGEAVAAARELFSAPEA